MRDVIDVTLAQMGNLSDAETAAVVNALVAASPCARAMSSSQPAAFYQSGAPQPRIVQSRMAY